MNILHGHKLVSLPYLTRYLKKFQTASISIVDIGWKTVHERTPIQAQYKINAHVIQSTRKTV